MFSAPSFSLALQPDLSPSVYTEVPLGRVRKFSAQLTKKGIAKRGDIKHEGEVREKGKITDIK